jgi:hypothetical protein
VSIVNKDDDFALVKVKHESAEAMTDALPVFSDKDAAEDFRDEHSPSWALEGILGATSDGPARKGLSACIRSIPDRYSACDDPAERAS